MAIVKVSLMAIAFAVFAIASCEKQKPLLSDLPSAQAQQAI